VTYPDGVPRDWLTTKTPMRDEHGHLQYVVTVSLEISDMKKAQRQLKKLSRAVEQSANGILITDLAGTIEYVNPKITEITGWTAAELIGRTPDVFGAGGTFRQSHRGLWKAISAGGEWRGTTLNRRKNGELYWCHESISAIRNANGEITNYLAIGDDVTAQKEMEDELRAAKTKAELADRTKSEFMANISHELRTPLNAIIGFAELARGEAFGPIGHPKYLEYVGDIYDSGRHLLSVINEILDLSKIEVGVVQLQETAISVATVFDASLRLVEDRARRANVKLSKEIPVLLPDLQADERILKQILLNLLSNAIKFTAPYGRVTLAASVTASGALEIAVRDTGIGMKPEDIPRAMQPFGQIDSSLTRKYEGTGLGLSLVKSFAEMHGGTLQIASRPGVGTTATVRFPAERIVQDVRLHAAAGGSGA
jgi:PAS domain S-box-containing protein